MLHQLNHHKPQFAANKQNPKVHQLHQLSDKNNIVMSTSKGDDEDDDVLMEFAASQRA